MKVLFDLTFINPSSFSGVAVYALRLLKGFEQLDAPHEIILLVTDTNKAFIERECPEFRKLVFQIKECSLLKKLHCLSGYVHSLSVNKIIKKYNISLLFSPYLHMGALFTTAATQIGVLHDAQSYVFFRKKGVKGFLYRLLTVRLLRRMAHIVTISNYAKSSVLEEIPFLNIPVSVIYNSVVIPENIEGVKFVKYSPYLLFVNTLMPYKNLETLIRAFAISKNISKYNLVVKAKKTPYWDDIIVPMLKEYKITDRVFLIQENFSEEKMASLYREAALFVSPSRMEGFGFTPIEAAMHKIPVISSKESALYETTMSLLNYYEPVNDFEALSKEICSNIAFRKDEKKLTKISNIYAKTYSPLRQAESFSKLFSDIKKK